MKHIPTQDELHEGIMRPGLTSTLPEWMLQDNKKASAAIAESVVGMEDAAMTAAAMGHAYGFVLGVYAATHGWETGQ